MLRCNTRVSKTQWYKLDASAYTPGNTLANKITHLIKIMEDSGTVSNLGSSGSYYTIQKHRLLVGEGIL